MRFSHFLKCTSLLLMTSLLLSACGLSTATPARPDQTITTLPASPSAVGTVSSSSATTGPTLAPPTSTPLPTVTPSPTPLPVPQGEIVLWEQLPPEQQNFLKSKIEAFQKLYPAVQFTVRHLDSATF